MEKILSIYLLKNGQQYIDNTILSIPAIKHHTIRPCESSKQAIALHC